MTSNTENCNASKQLSKEKSIRWATTSPKSYIGQNMEMSKKEICTLWYNEQDYKAFEKDCKDTVKIFKEAQYNHRRRSLINDDVCERGLEKRIYNEKECSRSQIAIITVLEEQSDHFYFGIQSPEALSELYQELSESCQEEAYVQGLQDAEDARACLEVPDKELIEILRTSNCSMVESLMRSSTCSSSSVNSSSSIVRRSPRRTARCWIPKMA